MLANQGLYIGSPVYREKFKEYMVSAKKLVDENRSKDELLDLYIQASNEITKWHDTWVDSHHGSYDDYDELILLSKIAKHC